MSDTKHTPGPRLIPFDLDKVAPDWSNVRTAHAEPLEWIHYDPKHPGAIKLIGRIVNSIVVLFWNEKGYPVNRGMDSDILMLLATEPVTRPWAGPHEAKLDWWYRCHKHDTYIERPVAAAPRGISFHRSGYLEWDQLSKDWECSPNGLDNWQPCIVEATK